MAVNKDEGIIEKAVEFFTQAPEDHRYEELGGDAKIPVDQRTDNPMLDANNYAEAHPSEYPEGKPYSDEQIAAHDFTAAADVEGTLPKAEAVEDVTEV